MDLMNPDDREIGTGIYPRDGRLVVAYASELIQDHAGRFFVVEYRRWDDEAVTSNVELIYCGDADPVKLDPLNCAQVEDPERLRLTWVDGASPPREHHYPPAIAQMIEMMSPVPIACPRGWSPQGTVEPIGPRNRQERRAAAAHTRTAHGSRA